MTDQPEHALNFKLGELLNGLTFDTTTFKATGEQKVSTGWADVRVDVDNKRIAVEAKVVHSKTGDREAVNAAKQAAKRMLANDAAFGAVMLYSDDAAPADLHSRTDLRWGTVTTDDNGEAEPVKLNERGTVEEFASWLSWLPLMNDQPELAAKLERRLTEIAKQIEEPALRTMTAPLGIRPNDKPALRLKAAKRLLLMLAAATMFHVRLHPRLRDLPEDARPTERTASGAKWSPPSPPGICRTDDDPVAAFDRAWELILMVDYKPIFLSARETLNLMHGDESFANAVRAVTAEAMGLASQTATLRYDLLGGVFHRVLDSARYDGSFYTTGAAATLLAGLAIPDDWVDWADPDAVANLRICDPACGSRTLLLAAMERMERLSSAAVGHGKADADERTLRVSALIEDALWGYDINSTATHLAATSLGLVAPDVDFKQMNLFHSKFGVERFKNTKNQWVSVAHLGSVDLLPASTQQLSTMQEHGSHSQVERQSEDERAAHPPPMDLVIMNPPFTRDSLRHDQFNKGDEQAIKDAEKKVLLSVDADSTKAGRLHSSDGMFILLGDYLSDDMNGRIALVLPAVVATATGASGRRTFLAQKFAIETIVISHDPKRINLSGATNISEMLIVARRRTADQDAKNDSPTKLIRLLRNPSNMLEAHETLEALKRAATGVREQHGRFVASEMPAERVQTGDWRQAAFASDWLFDQMLKLEELVGDKDRGAPCGMLHDIAAVGPDRRGTSNVFNRRSYNELATGKPGLWFHKGTKGEGVPNQPVTTMNTRPDSWLEIKSGKQTNADRLWEHRSRLLVAYRLRWNTMRLAAVHLKQPSIGDAWVPVAVRDPNHSKALCLWLNSTLGLLSLYSNQTLKSLDYPRWSMDGLRRWVAPNLDDDESQSLATVYDAQACKKLKRFNKITNCKVRAALDAAVADVIGDKIGFDINAINDVREALAAEPSISGKRK